jgi:hypothetical protein
MTRDLFDESISALREEYDGEHADPRASRNSILARANKARRRRARLLRWTLPLAAALAASTAWAATTGRLARVSELFVGKTPTSLSSSHRPGAPAPSTLAPATTASHELNSDPPTLESAFQLPPPAPPLSLPTASSGSAASGSATPHRSPELPTASSTSNVDADEAAYRVAHEAHFVKKDPSQALAAWDAYLARFPDGRFALEARYNRGVTLFRLGRKDEARIALEAFARGAYGGYREREARSLIDSIDAQQ